MWLIKELGEVSIHSRMLVAKLTSKRQVARRQRIHAISKRHSGGQMGNYARTSTTSHLWTKRFEALNDIGSANAPVTEAPRETFILYKKPSESFVEVYYPFATDKKLADEYVNVYGHIRFGKILEDMDACAGNISYLQADDNNPNTRPLGVVTASVDRIDLLDKLLLDRDMVMRGNVSYVGTSSMEVSINLQSKHPETNQFYPLMLATFTMVALSGGKPVPVNKVVPSTEEEKFLFAVGEGLFSSQI